MQRSYPSLMSAPWGFPSSNFVSDLLENLYLPLFVSEPLSRIALKHLIVDSQVFLVLLVQFIYHRGWAGWACFRDIARILFAPPFLGNRGLPEFLNELGYLPSSIARCICIFCDQLFLLRERV